MELHIKNFIRIIKEIGIYHYYIDCRKKRINDKKLVENIFSRVKPGVYFCQIIDNSLSWIETFTPYLWSELYDETRGMHCSDLLKNDGKINRLKRIVKKYGIVNSL